MRVSKLLLVRVIVDCFYLEGDCNTMAMGSASCVPAWWLEKRAPQLHEKKLGNVQFYNKVWQAGAHWGSSEDAAMVKKQNLQTKQNRNPPSLIEPKQWPGYDPDAARSDFLSRTQKRHANRSAFENSSARPRRVDSNHARAVMADVSTRNTLLAASQRAEARDNYYARAEARKLNAKLASCSSLKIASTRNNVRSNEASSHRSSSNYIAAASLGNTTHERIFG